ncbi:MULTISPECIES: hypothetical protein [Actinoplanes]|uniref:hypothetical protein n=1 Tax=Actinoplanes TaxID=1865 RepID=UPI0005F2B38E|nr:MULTISPECIES: hypothetical protein [Actinoplanes]GLY05542.1 hypothetical protein Acsp01_59210 [Actinoplanes sp. NBRC 101535]
MSLARRALTVVTALIASVLAAPVAASAAADTSWTGAPCADGRFELVDVDYLGKWGVVTGTATQCGPTVANGGFRIAWYWPSRSYGESPSYNARRFTTTDAGEQMGFGAAIYVPKDGVVPICLIAGDRTRVACALTGPRIGYIEPIDVDDVRVAKEYVGEGYDPDHNPADLSNDPPNPEDVEGFCGTCF